MPPIEGNVQKPSQLYVDFHGGLNIHDFWHRIADNELTVANNIRYDDRGAIQPRGGWGKLIGTISPLNNNIIGLVHGAWVLAGVLTRYVVVTDGTDVYYWTGAAWTKITGAVVMAPNNNTIVSFVSMNNLLIGYDGKNAPWTWDGTSGSISLLAGTPPVGNISIVWQNQLFWAGVATAQTRLYYSAVGDPASYPGSNFIDVPSAFDGDPITGLQILYGNLLIFKRNSVYILSLNADGTFTLSRNNSSVGCVSPYSVVAADNLIYFVSDKGLYAMNLYNVKQVCYKVEPRYAQAVTNQLQGSLARNRIMAFHYRYRNEIWAALDATTSGQDTHDRVLTHNYDVTDANGDPAVAEHQRTASEVASFVVTLNTNDFIDFTENGGSQASAQLTAGTYIMGSSSAVAGSLCALIKTKMEAAGSGTFTVTYNSTTRKLTITRSAGVFVFKFATGTNTAKTAATLMGFTVADTASAITTTSNSTTAAPVNTATAPAVMADYYQSNNNIIPMASFYDKYVYSFIEGQFTDASQSSTTNVAKQLVTKFFDLGDSNAVKTIRHIWMEASVAGGFPIFTFTISNDLVTTFGATLTPNTNIYNLRFDIGQVFSPAQGKYFQFGWLSNDGGTFSFFQFQLDVIFSGRRK